MRSPPALAAEYGELGCSGACSVQEPDATLPYTSSVETCTTGPTPASRHACRSTCTPVTLRSEEHTSELQSQSNLVCRLLLEKKKKNDTQLTIVTSSLSSRSTQTLIGKARFSLDSWYACS